MNSDFKTYFRILSFASPLSRFLPRYAILAIFGVLFGLINFSLLIPLLNVLFGVIKTEEVHIRPEFSFSVEYAKNYFNYFFSNMLAEHGKIGALKFVCVVIMVSVFFANVFKYFSQRVLSSMRTYIVANIRNALFEKITAFHIGYFRNRKKGDVISNLTNDVSEIENSIISSVQVILREPIMLIGYLVMLFIMSAKLTLFTLIVLPASGLIIAFVSKKLRKDAKIVQDVLGNILSIIEETISGVRIIKAFNAQRYIIQKFQVQNTRYKDLLKSIWNQKELASPLSEFLGVTVVAGVLLYGGSLVLENNSELSASGFLVYIILYSQILVPAKNISNAVTSIQRGLASGERILAILDTPVEVDDTRISISKSTFATSVKYNDVTFAYDKDEVLKKVNFEIHKGKTIALVGQSGSGKTTLADLLPRFYDCTSGSIFIDGVDIKNIKLADLRGLMGIVTQESILLNDTIFNNIAFGMPNATEEDVIAAAKIANAHEFISQMENGYQSNVGDRGSKLSGGQRQRISIARAVFKNPPILILDEATSALDTESERLVQEALINLMKNRTSLVIAHRLSTIQHADEIIVMQKGQIIERGNHQELINTNGSYKRLCDLQAFV